MEKQDSRNPAVSSLDPGSPTTAISCYIIEAAGIDVAT